MYSTACRKCRRKVQQFKMFSRGNNFSGVKKSFVCIQTKLTGTHLIKERSLISGSRFDYFEEKPKMNKSDLPSQVESFAA